MQMGHKNGTSENNSLTWNRASLQDVEPEKKKEKKLVFIFGRSRGATEKLQIMSFS